jgi:hypothetical protein
MSGKISLPEGIVLLLVAIGADLFELLNGVFGMVPVAGVIFLFLNSFVALISGIIINGYLALKKVNGTWALSGNIIELFPIVNVLPIKTITLIITLYLISQPKAQAIAEIAKTIKKPISKPTITNTDS